MALNEVGYENAALHGMITQKQRLAALAKFKSGTTKILIATDVASRGEYQVIGLDDEFPVQVYNQKHFFRVRHSDGVTGYQSQYTE